MSAKKMESKGVLLGLNGQRTDLVRRWYGDGTDKAYPSLWNSANCRGRFFL